MKVLPLPVWKKWKLLDQVLALEFNEEVVWVEPSDKRNKSSGKEHSNQLISFSQARDLLLETWLFRQH